MNRRSASLVDVERSTQAQAATVPPPAQPATDSHVAFLIRRRQRRRPRERRRRPAMGEGALQPRRNLPIPPQRTAIGRRLRRSRSAPHEGWPVLLRRIRVSYDPRAVLRGTSSRIVPTTSSESSAGPARQGDQRSHSKPDTISIAKREDVAILDSFIGQKT